MGGYKFIMAILAIVVCALLWIPLEYVSTLTAEIMNAGLTDAGAIAMNNVFSRVFYYSLFFIILIAAFYAIKTDTGEENAFN